MTETIIIDEHNHTVKTSKKDEFRIVHSWKTKSGEVKVISSSRFKRLAYVETTEHKTSVNYGECIEIRIVLVKR